VTAWSGVVNTTGVGLGRDTTLASLLGAVYLYPAPSTGYFLKAGVGVSSQAENSKDSTTSHGLGLSVGTGYDIPIGRRVFLTPTVSFVRASLGDMQAAAGLVSLHGVRHSVIDLSVGVVLH
jgi:hypothetical protein